MRACIWRARHGTSGGTTPFLKTKAAPEAPLAGRDDGVGAPRQIVEGEALDGCHRETPAERSVDDSLHLLLHGRHGLRLAGDLHPRHRHLALPELTDL